MGVMVLTQSGTFQLDCRRLPSSRWSRRPPLVPLNFAHVSLDHDGTLHLLVEVNSGRVVVVVGGEFVSKCGKPAHKNRISPVGHAQQRIMQS